MPIILFNILNVHIFNGFFQRGCLWPEEEDLSAVCQLLTYFNQAEVSESVTSAIYNLIGDNFEVFKLSLIPTNSKIIFFYLYTL